MIISNTLIERLVSARSVAVLTGAGISAESGVPTFRDPGGLWQQFKPEELANIQAFLRNPELVQGWYAHRRTMVQETTPNAGHRALAELESLVASFTLITQNVDGLHQRAGSRNVLELHGSLLHPYCIDCERPATEADLAAKENELLQCPVCEGLIRPDVVWFGESLPVGVFEQAQEAACSADVFLSIGTSAVVYPAADLPLQARQAGAYVAEFNLKPSVLSPYIDETVTGKAGETLPALLSALTV